MFIRKIIDLHMHLNGSFSMAFLEKIATRNGAMESFIELKKAQEAYKLLRKNKAGQKEQVANLWNQFFLINKMVQTLADIEEGTVDVIANSKAHHLEIRSTPKAIGPAAWQKYVESFVKGLQEGNRQFEGKKCARGLLSLDRTRHTVEQAYEIIDAVVAEKAQSGMLVGIDIGGNFLGPRTLTGDKLAAALRYALEKDIGLAIHIGEADTDLEKQDTDIVLNTLEEWRKTQPATAAQPFQGKVRLGHAIFLTVRRS